VVCGAAAVSVSLLVSVRAGGSVRVGTAGAAGNSALAELQGVRADGVSRWLDVALPPAPPTAVGEGEGEGGGCRALVVEASSTTLYALRQ